MYKIVWIFEKLVLPNPNSKNKANHIVHISNSFTWFSIVKQYISPKNWPIWIKIKNSKFDFYNLTLKIEISEKNFKSHK